MPDINMQVFEEVQRNQLVTEVDIQTQIALDDYQVKLSDIANPTQSQDNVVIDRHGEFLPHWNESVDFDTWVKISMEIAGKRILMLRGNSNVSNASNITDTMIFGDDFLLSEESFPVEYSSNPVMSQGTGWESVNVLDPWIIYNINDDSTYHMWYSGLGITHTAIGYATSSDGITWTKYGSNPIISVGSSGDYDDLYVHKMSVVLKDGTYYGYYSTQKSGGARTIAMATASSPEGPWTKYGTTPILSPTEAWEDDFYDTPSVIYDSDESIWKMWYGSGKLAGGEPESWSYATSSDGYSWTKYGSNPIAEPPGTGGWNSLSLGGVNIIKIDGVYHNYHNGFDDSEISTVGYITSNDGVTWNISNDTQIISLGAAGTWNDVHVYRPNVQIIDGVRKLWVNAADGSNERIGLYETSIAPDTLKWTTGGGSGSCDISDGIATLTGTSAALPYSFISVPAIENDVVLETRYLMNTDVAQIQILCHAADTTIWNNDMQLMMFDTTLSGIRHQSRSSGAWGGEDIIYANDLIINTWYRAKQIKTASDISYYHYDDNGNLLGNLVGNTDAPTDINYKIFFGSRNQIDKWDWIFVRKYTATEPTWSADGSEQNIIVALKSIGRIG